MSYDFYFAAFLAFYDMYFWRRVVHCPLVVLCIFLAGGHMLYLRHSR